MIDDVPKRFRNELANLTGLTVRPSPLASESQVGEDVSRIAQRVGGADALIIPTITMDAGILQLNVEIVDPQTQRVLYNTAFQSPIGKYSEMMRAATAALHRALRP